MRSCECAVDCLCPRNSISNVVASAIHNDLKKIIYVNKRCSTHMEPLWKVINIYTYAHKDKHTHIHMYIHIYICIYTHTQIQVRVHIHVHVHVRLRVRVRVGEGG